MYDGFNVMIASEALNSHSENWSLRLFFKSGFPFSCQVAAYLFRFVWSDGLICLHALFTHKAMGVLLLCVNVCVCSVSSPTQGECNTVCCVFRSVQ